MEINNFFLKQLQFSTNNLKQNSDFNVSTKTSSFDKQYESYKNKFEPKDDNILKPSEKTKDTTKTSTSTTKRLKSSNTQDDSEKDIQTKEDVSNKFIEELSEKLNVSVEDIVAVLDKLNIDVFDLLNTTNLNSFVQTLLEIEDPIELLTSSEAKEIYQQITDTIQEYKPIIDNIIELQPNETKSLENNNTETQNIKADVVENLNADNTKNTLSSNKESVSNLNQKPEENNLPIIEINNETKGEKQTKGNNEQKEEQNMFSNTVNNENYNYANNYNLTEFKQQAIVNELNSNPKVIVKDTHEIISQIVEKIKVDIKPDISEMKLILKPDNLGQLSLKITTENNIVTAQFVAESQQVKEVLQANFNSLKDTLQQLGLMVDELSVSVGQQNSEARQQFQQNQEKSKHRVEQIINNIDELGDVDIIYDKKYDNPYDLSDNQVDYMA